jgi:predicted dehydrogenase
MARVGVIGCGTVARYGHLPAILATPGLKLTALYDPVADAACSAAERFDTPGFTDMAAFLAAGLDAVVVTSPAPCHLENIRDAARAGLHILCEKPLGMTEAEIVEMQRLTADAGVMLFTAFDYRFSPVAQAIKQLVAGGAIGEVRSLRLIYIWNLHGKYAEVDGQRVIAQRRHLRMEEGGPLVDCGVHQIDLARWWLGREATHWSAAGAWVEDYAAPDHVYLHMQHAGGAHTAVEISYSYCATAAEPIAHFSYHLIGTDGLIRFDREAGIFEVRTATGTQQLPVAGEKNFPGMYAAFADALATGGSTVLPTAHDGLMATRISRSATDALIAARAAGVSAATVC